MENKEEKLFIQASAENIKNIPTYKEVNKILREMIDKEKYYTPQLEDFYVGYECEVNWNRGYSKEFTPFLFKLGSMPHGYTREYGDALIAYDDGYAKFRTPYLTKEQIEAKGWVYINPYGDRESFQFNTIDEDNNYLNYFMEVSFKDRWLKIEEMGSDSLFQGECKSINEFRKITKWLGIK